MAFRSWVLPAACLLLMSAAPLPGPAAAAPVCTPANSHVWFEGVVYDPAQRADFILDLENFEYFLAKLRQTYCIPDSQARILAFEGGFTHNGETYADATETAVKATLTQFGAAANAHPDSLFFFFLSSHGFFTTSTACGGGNRPLGSLSALKPDGFNDGNFRDCELGRALNLGFLPTTRMVVMVDCSFCGGFSDSVTPVSGTVPDGSTPVSAGVVKPNRVVVTGCAITTECFGGSSGGVSYGHLRSTLEFGIDYCDGWTAPGFPQVQGLDAPVNNGILNPLDGRCTASEWFFGAVGSVYANLDLIGVQQQFRIKYGFPDLASDVVIL